MFGILSKFSRKRRKPISPERPKTQLIGMYLDSVNRVGGPTPLHTRQAIRKNRGYSYIRQRERDD